MFPTLELFSLQSGCLCECAVCYVRPVSIPSAVLATLPAHQCMTCVTKQYGYAHTIIILTDLMNLLLTESEKWNGWMPEDGMFDIHLRKLWMYCPGYCGYILWMYCLGYARSEEK